MSTEPKQPIADGVEDATDYRPIVFAVEGSLVNEPVGVQVVYVKDGFPMPLVIAGMF